jgi:macrolide transport system ATP-binding/permease protein
VSTLEQAALRLYRRLVRAFPDEFHQAFGAGLADAAEDTVRDAVRHRGRADLLRVVPMLLADLAIRLVAEHARDAWRDARYAVRMLRHAPGFTLAAVTCLSIGIGVTTAIYSEFRSIVLRELPGVSNGPGLVRFQRPEPFIYFETIRDQGGPFSSVAAYAGPVPIVVSREGAKPQRVWGHLATPNYFEVLGTSAAVGRVFGADERTPGGAQAAVISDRLWKTQFGGDASVVGSPIRVNGQLVSVIGIAPPGFLGASPVTAAADIWIPTTAPSSVAPELAHLHDVRSVAFDVIGRLAPDMTTAQSEDALDALVRRLEVIHNDPAKDSKERRVRLLPGGRMFGVRDEDLPRAVGFPLVLVSLVLLMACGNVGNMLLSRSEARRQEIAVRLSLGAGPGRILRQLLTESLMLAALGAAGGVALAFWLVSWLESLRPLMPDYGFFEMQFDWQALVFSVLIAAGSGILFGLAPARRASRQDITAGLKPGGTSSAHRALRSFSLRNLVVFQQVAASVVLLLITGFVVIGWQRSAGLDMGFDPRHLYLVRLDPVRDGYTVARAQDFFEKLPDQLRRVPGVTDVSLAQTLPPAMSGREAMVAGKIDIASGTSALGKMHADRVGAAFFQTLGARLRRGREFTERDHADNARVLIVNETMAQRTWPGEDPLGRPIDLDRETWQVIGVVGDIRSMFPLAPTQPAVYLPITPAGFGSPSKDGVVVSVRVAPGFDVPTKLRQAIDAIDPTVTVFQITPMTDEVTQGAYLVHVASAMYGGMGIFGLILASVGLAGVTAHAVARRTHEIGIRMALGARRGSVLWLVLRESGTIVAAGLVVGFAAALALTRALASFVEAMAEVTHTSTSDPVVLVAGPALLAAFAMAACYLPARKSTRIDPVVALRSE